MSAKILAIIPARGGSKRIANKNILDFEGKPMIAWTIEAALNAGIFEHVVVSTEDEKIAEVARSYGASVPFLRNDHFDDMTPVSEATITGLKQSQDYFGCQYDVVIQLMPNCPLRTSQDIVQAYKNFQQKKMDFQISCFAFMWMNPWWAVKLSSEGVPEHVFPEAMKSRSQDLPELYCPTGAIWIAKADALINSGTFYGNGHRFFPIHWKSAMDIDTYDDLSMANALVRLNSEEIKID